MDAPEQSEPNQPEPRPPDASAGLDIMTIGLLVFFISLIVIVAVLLLLPILAG